MSLKKFSLEVELKICEKYREGLSTIRISKIYFTYPYLILLILKRHNVEIRMMKQSHLLFSQEVELEICKKYLTGQNSSELAKELKCSKKTILNILKRNNVDRRNQSEYQNAKKYTLDESYFDVIDSEDRAYFLGWLYADGYNYNLKRFVLQLKESDKHILENFKIYLKTDKILSRLERKHISCTLTITSKYMSERLSELGCVQRKSLILKFPTEEQVAEHLLSHFIRGYFEGDGWICFNDVSKNRNYMLKVGIMSTEKFLKGVQKFLIKNGINFSNITHAGKKYNKNTYNLTVTNILDVLKFKELIYDNYFKKNLDGDLYLKRKYDKFVEIQNYVDNNKNIIDRLINLRETHKPENEQKIKNLYNIEKISQKKIAKLYNVSCNTIRKIIQS